METELPLHIRPLRASGLPADIRDAIKQARHKHGWSQRDLSRRAALPQTHISGIESGRITPRFNTLLDLVRILDLDFLLVPRGLVPIAHALIADYERNEVGDSLERSLYADEGSDGH
jgi:transcriptional regulator with XRE-family HTH domain